MRAANHLQTSAQLGDPLRMHCFAVHGHGSRKLIRGAQYPQNSGTRVTEGQAQQTKKIQKFKIVMQKISQAKHWRIDQHEKEEPRIELCMHLRSKSIFESHNIHNIFDTRITKETKHHRQDIHAKVDTICEIQKRKLLMKATTHTMQPRYVVSR